MSLSVLTPSGWSPMGGSTGWQRPADWLPLDVTPGEQKVKILAAIGPGTSESDNVMTVLARPSYRVDWGDGTPPENVNDNVVGKHLYDPSTLTSTSEGWKQAVITVTPQSGNFTLFSIVYPYYTGKTWTSPAVDLVIGPDIASATMAGSSRLRRVIFLTPMNGTSYPLSTLSSLRQMQGKLRISGTSVSSMFSANYLQEEFPEIEFTGTCSNFTAMFNFCSSMTTPPVLNVSNATATSSMFYGCSSMTDAPDWLSQTSKSTNFTSMFNSCYRLQRVPTLNTSSATLLANAFQNCVNLITAPAMDTSKATNVSNMFNGCSSLIEVAGQLDFSLVSNITGIFTGCNALRHIAFAAGKGSPITHVLVGMIDAPTLDAIYTSLPSVSGQTITVTNLPGTLSDTPSIATAKGWTVTGS